MRISDWSSDVCSSDLLRSELGIAPAARRLRDGQRTAAGISLAVSTVGTGDRRGAAADHPRPDAGADQGISLQRAPASRIGGVAGVRLPAFRRLIPQSTLPKTIFPPHSDPLPPRIFHPPS